MPDALALALGLPGLPVLIVAALLAGLVRGFTGFGTALVFLPPAALVLSPFEAITAMIVMDLVGPLILVPRAVRDGAPSDILRLAAGALIALPLGVWILSQVDPRVFRWAVSLIALGMLILLARGARYSGRLTPPLVFATGALGGFLAGAVGLPGPPVIMLYLASTLPAAAIRANLLLYLLLTDTIMMSVLAAGHLLVLSAVAVGAVLILPYMAGNAIGGWLFRPSAERFYRRAAYGLIAGSAIVGLPVWS